jgi:hypothetical protein
MKLDFKNPMMKEKKECLHNHGTVLKLRFFEGARYYSKDKTAPRWRFHLEKVCASCGRHIQFVKQEEDFIKKLDKSILVPDYISTRTSIKPENHEE